MEFDHIIATLTEHKLHWERLLSQNICNRKEGKDAIEAFDMAIRSFEAMRRLHNACYTKGLCGDAFADEVCDILNEFEEVIEAESEAKE